MSCRVVVPNLFGAKNQFRGGQFSSLGHGGDLGMVQAHYVLCTLFLLLYQLHLRPSGLRSQRLVTPDVL